jgi:hypothetical protein
MRRPGSSSFVTVKSINARRQPRPGHASNAGRGVRDRRRAAVDVTSSRYRARYREGERSQPRGEDYLNPPASAR